MAKETDSPTNGGARRKDALLLVGLASIAVIALVVAFLRHTPEASVAVGDALEVASMHPSEPTSREPARQATISLASVAVPGTAERFQQEAEGVASELRNRFPNLPEALHVSAMLHAQLRQTAEAEKLWRKCIELAPQDERFYVNLAAIAMDRGDSEVAVETLRQALESGSSSPDVYHHLGVALNHLGRCDEAEAVARQALVVSPQSSAHWVVLGQAQLKQGKAAGAEASLRKALALGSASPDVYFALGNACARQDKHEDAAKFRELFAELKKQQPLAPQQRFQMLSTAEARRTAVTILSEASLVHSKQDDFLEAERLLLRSLALDPSHMESCRLLASLYHRAGMHAEERVVRQRLVALDPFSFDNHVNLAQVSDQLGEPEAAEAALKSAVSLWPRAAVGYSTLAQFYVKAGKANLARWYAQEAVRREPTVEGYLLLASTCRLLGDESSAAAAIAAARDLNSNGPGPNTNTESQSSVSKNP